MPKFPDIQSNMPLVIPLFAALPTVPTLQIAATSDSAIAGPSQELQEIKNSQQKMENILQTIGNELVSLKKQQYQGRPPYQQQNPGGNSYYQQQPGGQQQQNQGVRPPYQNNYQGNKQNVNPRPFQTYAPAPLNAVKDIVPAQNNFAAEYEWCYPCNQPHNQATCSNGVINQALMVQNAASTQPEIAGNAIEQ